MSVIPTIVLILDEDGFTPEAVAHGESTPIGAVRLDSPFSRINVTSTSVEALLATADAFQEAARLLRQQQLTIGRRAAVRVA